MLVCTQHQGSAGHVGLHTTSRFCWSFWSVHNIKVLLVMLVCRQHQGSAGHVGLYTTSRSSWSVHNIKILLVMLVYTHQGSAGHVGLYTCASGSVISEDNPFLGAASDAAVCDPS